ncbi:MAG: Gfo/Idh/MocA family oxidoreductase, partial [Clostridia bacterium]|nr:Gfo/Idh/MocA family oxidoreductase [Clostridia bacterium]
MKKIAILGCENSHANSFIKYVKTRPEFADIEIVGVYSDETAPCEKLASEFGVKILSSYDEVVGQIDGLIITARHGDNHYKYAKPYIASGIPMFIDKPITISESEAITFMKELRDAKVAITGGSSLKQDSFIKKLREEAINQVDGPTIGGFVRAPIACASTYGGYYFYAQHLVEMVCEIFGRYPNGVLAKSYGDKININFYYDDYQVTGLNVEHAYTYYALRSATNGNHGGVVDIGEGDND